MTVFFEYCGICGRARFIYNSDKKSEWYKPHEKLLRDGNYRDKQCEECTSLFVPAADAACEEYDEHNSPLS